MNKNNEKVMIYNKSFRIKDVDVSEYGCWEFYEYRCLLIHQNKEYRTSILMEYENVDMLKEKIDKFILIVKGKSDYE